jgi:outer membrane putative beta-barrel porin/alpha-amylase
VTDRPDITEASTVIPYGSLQAENGPVWTTRQHLQTLDGLETRLRFGIARLTELRLGVPDYFYNRGRPEHASGFGDLVVGAKQQLGPLPGDFDLSVIGAVSLPTGTSGVSSGGVDPEIKFPWSRELTGPWSIGGMWSAFWTTEHSRRNFTWEPTLYIERQLPKGVDAFVEYARQTVGPYGLHPHGFVKERTGEDLPLNRGLTAGHIGPIIGLLTKDAEHNNSSQAC